MATKAAGEGEREREKKTTGRGRVRLDEENSSQEGMENEKGEKKTIIRLEPSQQRDIHKYRGDRQERERERELGSVLLPALCLFGISCFTDSAARSMELEPQRFST